MRISLEWLKRYVDIEEAPSTLADDLTMFGLNVEEYRQGEAPFSGVVFGRVLEVRKHPAADRLTLCSVDAGGEKPLGIVCGASNVRGGLGVAVALPGAVLAGGFKIKKSKIRGEVSEGMICSEKELGIGDDADGIMELDFDERPGAPLEVRLGGADVMFDIEVTPNRPDLLCHFGVAREVAALYRRPVRPPERFALAPGPSDGITIENFDDCPRYAAAFIEDVKIAPSPLWMQKLITAAGFKPINTIVDVTNFVLLELGQPLHAFDRNTLRRDSIVVRRARDGESLVTLDGVTRALNREILVIADAERPIALAGVMGGLETEVTDRTKRVLLESAMFDRRAVRRTRQSLKLETEASYRFEREADIGAMARALERACRLITEIGAGRPAAASAERIAPHAAAEGRTVHLRVEQANRVMGTRLAAGELAQLLGRLELSAAVSEKVIQVTVPTFRRDLVEEIDLVEEAARVYGYDNIGLDEVPRCTVFSHPASANVRNEGLRRRLAARGFAETITTSFMDPNEPAHFGWGASDPRGLPVMISNPLTAAQSALRTSLLPGLLAVVRRNTPAEQEGVRIFEMGKVFFREEGGGLPLEQTHLTAVFTRKHRPVQWIGDQRDFDFFDMKGELESLIDYLGIAPSVAMERERRGDAGFLFSWRIKDRLLAEAGLCARAVASRYDIDTPLYFFTVILDALPAKGTAKLAFTAPIPYPAVKRDLCLVASNRVTCDEIRECIEAEAKNLESITLFDYYRGGHLGEGKRSYTFRLLFRSPQGTLDDQAIDREVEAVLSTLQRELQVTLRSI